MRFDTYPHRAASVAFRKPFEFPGCTSQHSIYHTNTYMRGCATQQRRSLLAQTWARGVAASTASRKKHTDVPGRWCCGSAATWFAKGRRARGTRPRWWHMTSRWTAAERKGANTMSSDPSQSRNQEGKETRESTPTSYHKGNAMLEAFWFLTINRPTRHTCAPPEDPEHVASMATLFTTPLHGSGRDPVDTVQPVRFTQAYPQTKQTARQQTTATIPNTWVAHVHSAISSAVLRHGDTFRKADTWGPGSGWVYLGLPLPCPCTDCHNPCLKQATHTPSNHTTLSLPRHTRPPDKPHCSPAPTASTNARKFGESHVGSWAKEPQVPVGVPYEANDTPLMTPAPGAHASTTVTVLRSLV